MASKKMTLKTLGEDLNVVKKQVKEIEALKIIIEDLKDEVKQLKSKGEHTGAKDKKKCNQCEESFDTSLILRKHVVECHTKVIRCRICDDSFSQNCELEEHMEEHDVEKEFKCNVCEKDFYLQWRLKKHLDVHSEQTRMCRFFLSNTHCPFDLIGCKFKHENKTLVTDDVSNTSIEKKNDEPGSDEDRSDTNLENQHHDESDHQDKYDDSDSGVKYGENDCHLCEKTFTCLDDLCDHFQTSHEEYYAKTRNLVVY